MNNTCEQPQVDREPLQYFVPQQMSFLVEHEGQVSQEQINAFLNAATQIVGARIVSRRVLTFTRRQAKAAGASMFSLVFVTVPDSGDAPARLILLIDRLNATLVQKPVAGLTLQITSPNWLLSGAPEHIGTGGPGAVPVADTTVAGAAARDFLAADAPWGWRLPEQLPLKLPPERRGAGVDIAILDTAPCVHDLVEAYDTWQATHPLLQSLLRPGGPLHVEPAAYADLVRLAGYKLQNHRYLMADHGLFVAGVIHTLAPQANLHLIEVLNPFGVGDLESIALGLWRLSARKMQRLLINCSLVVNIPLQGHSHKDLEWERLLKDPEMVRQMGFPLEWICDALAGEQSQVIAAAGNDSKEHELPARFPAAFASVVGVGALQDGVQPAPYSNLSDTPIPNSIATFGGASDNGLAMEGKSVLGVFTGALPGTKPGTTIRNDNGWAWWSGTSFATPVITGTLAALMSEGMSATAAVAAIRSADTSHAPTGVGEGIFAVRQGS